MKNIDIETLYSKIHKQINQLSKIVNITNIDKCIKSLRLKPYSLFVDRKLPTKIQYHWVDEFGNSIYFDIKKMNVVYNDPAIHHNTKISTDLFYGRSYQDTVENGRSFFRNENHCLVFGKDEYFRCFMRPKFNPISPLEIGFQTINDFISNKLKIETIGNRKS